MELQWEGLCMTEVAIIFKSLDTAKYPQKLALRNQVYVSLTTDRLHV